MFFNRRAVPPDLADRSLFSMSLTADEKGAFKLHLLSQIFGAVAAGVMMNHDYIATNGLGASVVQITLLAMIWPVSNLFSVVTSHFVDSSNRHSTAIFIGAALRLPIALMFFSSSVNFMLILLFLYFSSNSLVIPGQNAVMRSRYNKGHRGLLFGWTMTALNLFALPAAMVVGALLDADFSFYRWLFVVEGVMGSAQAVVMGFMARGMKDPVAVAESNIRDFFKSIGQVLKGDREFLKFEMFFMIYGFGFMTVQPALPFYSQEVLGLSYEQYALAKGVIGQLGLLLLAPFLGSKMDKLHPFKFTGVVCFILAGFPLLLVGSSLFPSIGIPLYYAAWAAFAIGIAGVVISWNMSSMFFAPEGRTATYQGLHVTATAMRGFFAPVLGSVVMKYLGFTANFLLSFLFFTTASILFLLHYRKRSESPDSD
ncbi:MAG: MFS transporter [Candidatus Fermentibacteraceae bacterium]|nr:MFS transporter [Candidatus Fermentibacteraceae bacterium]